MGGRWGGVTMALTIDEAVYRKVQSITNLFAVTLLTDQPRPIIMAIIDHP